LIFKFELPKNNAKANVQIETNVFLNNMLSAEINQKNDFKIDFKIDFQVFTTINYLSKKDEFANISNFLNSFTIKNENKYFFSKK
jgi:hypothetical protein